MEKQRSYIAIDLKSFYASVECIERGLDPLNANLVVADPSRTEKTICLAVSPALKSYGIPGRARLFEVIKAVGDINAERKSRAPGRKFEGKSYYASELKENPALSLDYIIAPPRMAKYMEVSSRVYNTYLQYVAPEDIHVYSIDEVFIDVTDYLNTYKMTPRELAMTMIKDVLAHTGITATAGIGPNMYLCKIAMDIEAKHIDPDENGVRIAELDEMSFREKLWDHRPLTDFWRIGNGYARRLESSGMYTMGDVARVSVNNEDILYKMFGINAELLIDHAWGWEPARISDVKKYKPENSSLTSGQVLHCPYDFEGARLVVKEMTDLLVLDMVEKRLVADQMVLTIGYDISNIKSNNEYVQTVKKDFYGREVPEGAHGSVNLGRKTSSSRIILEKILELYDSIVNPKLLIRRISIVANHVIPEVQTEEDIYEQMDLFTDYEELDRKRAEEKAELSKERKQQEAIIGIKKRFGKNSILKGMNFQEGATAKDRNSQVGGHKA